MQCHDANTVQTFKYILQDKKIEDVLIIFFALYRHLYATYMPRNIYASQHHANPSTIIVDVETGGDKDLGRVGRVIGIF